MFVLLQLRVFRQSIQGCTSVLVTYIDCSNSVVVWQRLQQLQSSGHCHLMSFLRLPSPSDTEKEGTTSKLQYIRYITEDMY